jgi:hypothetical protein
MSGREPFDKLVNLFAKLLALLLEWSQVRSRLVAQEGELLTCPPYELDPSLADDAQ